MPHRHGIPASNVQAGELRGPQEKAGRLMLPVTYVDMHIQQAREAQGRLQGFAWHRAQPQRCQLGQSAEAVRQHTPLSQKLAWTFQSEIPAISVL